MQKKNSFVFPAKMAETSASINWDLITPDHDRMMIKDLYEAAEKAEALDRLATIKDSMDPLVWEINKHMQYDGHSGFSFWWTLRQVQYLAANGMRSFLGERGDPVLVAD